MKQNGEKKMEKIIISVILLVGMVIAGVAAFFYRNIYRHQDSESRNAAEKKRPAVNPRLIDDYVALQREIAMMHAGEQWRSEFLKIVKTMQKLIGMGNAFAQGKVLERNQIEIYFEDGIQKILYRELGTKLEKLPPRINFLDVDCRKKAESKTEYELKTEIADTKNRLKRNQLEVQAYRVTRSLNEEGIFQKVLAMDPKEPSAELTIQLADKAKRILLSNKIYPFFYDTPEVKESDRMQRAFEEGRFLSIDIPAIFVRDWRSNEYELLGSEYTGEAVGMRKGVK